MHACTMGMKCVVTCRTLQAVALCIYIAKVQEIAMVASCSISRQKDQFSFCRNKVTMETTPGGYSKACRTSTTFLTVYWLAVIHTY